MVKLDLQFLHGEGLLLHSGPAHPRQTNVLSPVIAHVAQRHSAPVTREESEQCCEVKGFIHLNLHQHSLVKLQNYTRIKTRMKLLPL